MTTNNSDLKQLTKKISNYLIFKPFRLSLSCLSKLNDLRKSISNEILSTRSTSSSSIKKVSQFRENSFSKEYMSQLCEMWKENQFCDLILVIDDKEYLAHRVAIAFHSIKYKEYFELNKKEFVIRLVLKATSSIGIENVLKYVYKNQLELSIENVEAIVSCAQELEINELINKCEMFLLNSKSSEIFQALKISNKLNLKLSFDYLFSFMCLNLDKCIKQTQFVNLDKELLIKLMTCISDKRIKRNETILLERLIDWLDYNQLTCSLQTALTLINYLDFEKISSNDIEAILARNSFVYEIPSLIKFIELRMNKSLSKDIKSNERAIHNLSQASNEQKRKNDLIINDSKKRRLEFNTHSFKNVLLISGGFNITSTKKKEYDLGLYVYDGKEFVSLAAMPDKRAKHKMINLKAKLYIIGGLTSNGTDDSKLADLNYSFSFKSRKWELIASLKDLRSDFACTIVNDLIYVCGGVSSNNELIGSIECYDPNSNVWTLIKTLVNPRKSLCLNSLENTIYIVGGIGPNDLKLKNVTLYNTLNKLWFKSTPLQHSFINITLVKCLGNLYLIGAKTEDLLLKIYKLDANENVWKEKINLNQTWSNYYGFSLEEKIYVWGELESNCLITYDTNSSEHQICLNFSKKFNINQALCLIQN